MKLSEHVMLETVLPVFTTQRICAAEVGDIAQPCCLSAQELKSEFNSKRNLSSDLANIYWAAIRSIFRLAQLLPLATITGPAELFCSLLGGWLQNSKQRNIAKMNK